MKNKDVINFKYKGNLLTNIISILFICLFIISAVLVYKSNFTMIIKIIIIICIGLLISLLMYLANKRLSILNGSFIFNNELFYYETLRKSYEIGYDEIQYVSKEIRVNNNAFFNRFDTIFRISLLLP